MTAQPIIAVDVLDRLAGRADVREFTNPRAWEWEWHHNGVIVTYGLHDEPIRLDVDGEEVDPSAPDDLRVRLRRAHAEVGQDLMSRVGLAPGGCEVTAEEYGTGFRWIYRRGPNGQAAYGSDSGLSGDAEILEEFRAAGRRWIRHLTLPAPIA